MHYRGGGPGAGTGYANNADNYQLGHKRQRPAEHYYGPPVGCGTQISAPPISQRPPLFPIIRIRGLPFYCTQDDIAGFFFGLDVVDVLLVHKMGRFTGEAYCLFGYPLQVDIALRKDRQNMGSRYIEIFPSNREEYYKAIANEVRDACGLPTSPPPKPSYPDDNNKSNGRVPDKKPSDARKQSAVHTGVLRMRGLPYSAAMDDIVGFFNDFKLSEDAIHFVMNWEGRPSGDAFVEFANAEDAKAAMDNDRKRIGNRYVELFPSTPEEMNRALSKLQ